jgi:hypothetical protein
VEWRLFRLFAFAFALALALALAIAIAITAAWLTVMHAQGGMNERWSRAALIAFVAWLSPRFVPANGYFLKAAKNFRRIQKSGLEECWRTKLARTKLKLRFWVEGIPVCFETTFVSRRSKPKVKHCSP